MNVLYVEKEKKKLLNPDAKFNVMFENRFYFVSWSGAISCQGIENMFNKRFIFCLKVTLLPFIMLHIYFLLLSVIIEILWWVESWILDILDVSSITL